MWRSTLLALLLTTSALATEKMAAPQLISLANSNPAGLREAIITTFDAKDLNEGTAWAGRGPDFFFTTEAATQPLLFVDGAAGPPLREITGSDIWYASAQLEVSKLHSFYYLVNGSKFGGRLELPAWSAFLSAARSPHRHALAENHSYQQDLRRHEKRVLDLRSRPI